MKKFNIFRCITIIVTGIVGVTAIIVDPSNAILALALMGVIAFVLCD